MYIIIIIISKSSKCIFFYLTQTVAHFGWLLYLLFQPLHVDESSIAHL